MDRIEREILHSKKIKDSAGLIWGWETPAGRMIFSILIIPECLIPIVKWMGGMFEKIPILKEIAGSLVISGEYL
ncbi:MAG: hypothetical protein AB1630_07710 [bacterium]